MDNDLLANVRSAKSEVAEAEDALEALLKTLERNPRAEKTTISKALESAFEKLRAARRHLNVLEKLARAKNE
jgi:hypothetical protein